MSERQANIALFNSKMAELEVPASNLLWDKIEAQLDFEPSIEAEGNPATEALSKPALLKIITAIVVTVTIIVVGLLALKQNNTVINGRQKKENLQSSPPVNEMPNPNNSSVQKEVGAVGSSKKKTYQHTDSLEKDLKIRKVPGDIILIDTNRNNAPAALHNKLPDSAVMPSIHLPVIDTSKPKAQPVKKQDDYYFDVQKRKGKKG